MNRRGQSCLPRRGERGQTVVEVALLLPLTVFLVLGSLQLFLMLNARIQAQYAVFRAVRVGVVNHADCRSMSDAALANLLPSITRTDSPKRLADAFEVRGAGRSYRYLPSRDSGHDRAIFWLERQAPDFDGEEDADFDQWDVGPEPRRLDGRLVYWYALRIPFANWSMSRMFLGWFRLREMESANPLMPVQGAPADGWRGPGALDAELAAELRARAAAGQYAVPIVVNASMKMMSPVRGPFAARCRPQ